MYFKVIFGKNTTFFSFLLIVFFILLSFKSYEKNIGSPYIQRIFFNNYGFNNNNFSILQDQNGIIYIGNSNGIIQYTGTHQEILNISGTPYMDIDEAGIIYVGIDNDFGIISNTNVKPEFVSLRYLLKENINDFGQIKKVITQGQEVFFCTNQLLLKYSKDSVTIVEQNKGKLSVFKSHNRLYVLNNEGLYQYVNNQLKLAPQCSFFKEKKIVDILPFNEQLLVKTENDGFYICDNYSIEKFNTKADTFIDENIYSCGCSLNNGNFAFGTVLSGIIIIDQNGEIVTLIDETSGLLSQSVNALYFDVSNNLWALHDQGISRIEIPSAYSYFNKNNGIHGNVKAVKRFNNNLYVATSLGVFYLPLEPENESNLFSSPHFISIKNIKSMCYDFHVFNNKLYVTSSKGLYEIIYDKAKLYYNRDASEITCVFHSRINPEYIFLGYHDGFSAIRNSNNILIIEKKLEGINDKITGIAQDISGNLWLSGNENGVYKIEAFDIYNKDLTFKHYNIETISAKNIEWIIPYALNDCILFSTSQGLFRYNRETDTFFEDTLLISDNKNEWIFPIVQDEQDNIWFNINSKGNVRNKTVVKNFKDDSSKTLFPLPLNRIKDFYITSIQPLNNGIVWFGGFEGLIRYNINSQPKSPGLFHTFLHKITIGNDSVIYQTPFGQIEPIKHKTPLLSYNDNTINFKFSTNDYESEDLILYKYKLDGFDTSWSNWTTQNFKEYTNLFEGKYQFRLVAKNIYDQLSNEVVYEFKIKPPFFRSVSAYFLYILTIFLLSILIGKWRAYYFAREKFRLENIIHERTEEVIIQKEKADNLLERVLPKNTAKELKSGRKAGPYHYNMVTVLFSDIQGFTKISEQMDSELLIDELDRFFLQFDSVVEKYNIEKIKTIGDAYMCAGGIPIKNRTNPVEVVLAAIEMQNFMKELKRTSDNSTKHIWDLRIGIDTGPVVAGVLGRSKISYDIWGGTVNTASRMEASGEPGKINITENTYMLIKDFFICQYRGKMPVKYKGEIDMYFVEGFKPHLAADIKGHIPNEDFFTQLQLLRVNDVEEFVLSKLEEGLPDNLYYHNVKHTIDVVTQVELIGRSEGIGDEDMLILKTAAVFHDMGHLVNYDTHEEESVKLAKKILPEYQYNDSQIERICKLITVTKMPPEPKNLLEEIMCDADLDYLGRTDFVPVSINLYKELAERKKIDSILEWNQMQLKFIKNHQYFTKTAQKLREVNKKNQLENIQREIKKELEMNDE